jgi:carboxyl-terminal processing protease
LSEKQKEIIKTYTTKYKTDTSIQKIIKLKTKINSVFGDNLDSAKLNFTSIFDYLNNYTLLWKEIKALSENEYDFTISNTSFDIEKNKNNDYLSNIHKVNVKNIKTNFTIFEATKIIGDLK